MTKAKVVTICEECKGNGEKFEINWPFAFFTFGLTLLVDLIIWSKCKKCNGKGHY